MFKAINCSEEGKYKEFQRITSHQQDKQNNDFNHIIGFIFLIVFLLTERSQNATNTRMATNKFEGKCLRNHW